MTQETTPSNYEVELHCENCNFFFKRKFTKGEEVPKLSTCNRCECVTAIKSWTREIKFPTKPFDIKPYKWPVPPPIRPRFPPSETWRRRYSREPRIIQ